MRFMVLVKANKDSEAGMLPDEKELLEMGKFNDELIKAGVMLAGEGLQSSAKGKRIKFTPGGKPTVTDGPFAETKELLAGFWMVQMKSMEECVAWFKRCPPERGRDRDPAGVRLRRLRAGHQDRRGPRPAGGRG